MNNKNGDTTSSVKPDTSSASAPAADKKKGRRLLAGFVAALGIPQRKHHKPEVFTTDTGTRLAHQRTDLAMDRTYWAAQRTLMGWIRTSLSMISFGFTIGKLGQTMQDIQVVGLRGIRMVGVDTIAYFLVIIGTAALFGAAVQYSGRVHDLCEQGLERRISIEFIVALVVSVMGVVAFGALVMNL